MTKQEALRIAIQAVTCRELQWRRRTDDRKKREEWEKKRIDRDARELLDARHILEGLLQGEFCSGPLGEACDSEETPEKDLPKTVGGAVCYLIMKMPEPALERVRIAEHRSDLIRLHHGIGTWIRNELGLWESNDALLGDTGKEHPDDASGVILEALWEELDSIEEWREQG